MSNHPSVTSQDSRRGSIRLFLGGALVATSLLALGGVASAQTGSYGGVTTTEPPLGSSTSIVNSPSTQATVAGVSQTQQPSVEVLGTQQTRSLAFTGGDVAGLAAIAGGAVAAGGVLVMTSRRRRAADQA